MSKLKLGYDDAVFRQLLQKRVRNGVVSKGDVRECFKIVCAGLVETIYREKPELTEEQLDASIDQTVLDGVIIGLQWDGWRVEE